MQTKPAPIALKVPDLPDLPRVRTTSCTSSDLRPAAPHPSSEISDNPARTMMNAAAAKGPKKRGRPKKSAEPAEEGKKAA